jgi:hypothetical protein
MSGMKNHILILAYSLTSLCTLHATDILMEDFSGSAAAPLNDSITTTGNGTWIAASTFHDNGSITGQGSAWLAYDFVSGNLYSLSVDVDVSGAANNIFGGISFTVADFSLGKSTVRINDDPDYRGAWVLRNNSAGTGNGTTLFVAPPLSNSKNNSTITQTSGTLTLLLDTTESIWTFDAYLDGIKITDGSYNSAGGNFSGVGLYASGAGIAFDNFVLSSSTIPESSSSVVLMALCAALAVTMHGIRSKKSLR